MGINKLQEKFEMSPEENKAFKYIGLEVKQKDQEIIKNSKRSTSVSYLLLQCQISKINYSL